MIKTFQIIKKVVADMGGTIEDFVPERGCYYVFLKGKRIFLERNISITRQSFISFQLTRCKEITYKLLTANSLPSPTTECFYNKNFEKVGAVKKLEKLNYPVILKNAVGSNSSGLFPFVNNANDAVKILKRELPHYRSMIVQEMVFGKEYRVLVLGEKVIGALELIHPYIVGDGLSTIRSLIHEKQRTTEKRTKFDARLLQTLRSQKVSLSSVIPKNKTIFFKRNSGWDEGGEARDVTDLVHKDVRDICVSASKTVGKYLVGIDVICKDITKKQSKKSFNILEINGRPDIYIHYNPTYGKSRNVLKDIINYLVKASAPFSARNTKGGSKK